jgi:predicted O-methyltransferase YrrM
MDKNFVVQRKKWYKSLATDRSKFEINDLGAGSKTLRKTRSVRELFKKSSSNGIYGRLLYQLSKHYRPQWTLELGTSIGLGTVHLKGGYPEGQVITVEGCRNTLRAAERQFDFWNFSHLTSIESDFDSFLERKNSLRYDLVFIDGNHTSQATLRYLKLLEPQIHDETLLVLDDIRWNEDMWSCWNQLIHDETYHVSIDLGRMGILMKKSTQTKEHFVIRPFIYKSKFI